VEEVVKPTKLSIPLEDDEDTEDSDDTSKRESKTQPIPHIFSHPFVSARRGAAVGRPENETQDEKKARKQAIKAEKQVRSDLHSSMTFAHT